MSPRKFYGGVKSKVAGNIKTINYTKRTKRVGEPSPDRNEFIKREIEYELRGSPNRTTRIGG